MPPIDWNDEALSKFMGSQSCTKAAQHFIFYHIVFTIARRVLQDNVYLGWFLSFDIGSEILMTLLSRNVTTVAMLIEALNSLLNLCYD